MSDFIIRPYAHTDADAAKLAVMWNESDDQWPGTFTKGVPFTTEHVREWMAREIGLTTLVVDDPAQERIVGSGSLRDTPDKEKTCFVAPLNVHPAYQGKSLARRMLVQMVDQAVELGYHLMTIGTWSGNLKSVPLYKKVGFFWVPDTSVYMENFVPLVRQLPVAQRYFQQHDWYNTFKRELRQVEDDQRHGAMKVYRYRWEEGSASLSVLIDREAKTLTGVETETLAAYAELDETEPAHGLSYRIRWRVTNKRDEAVNVSLLVAGAPGINISQQSAFVLAGGQERVVEDRFTVSPDIEPAKKDWPAPHIRTMLVVGSDLIELGTGVRPHPAIAVSTEPAYPVLLPGRPQTIHVQLQNHLDRPLHGLVSIRPQIGLKTDWQGLRHDFDLKTQGYTGLPLTVTCDEAGAIPLRFSTTFEVDDEQVHSRPDRIALLSLPPGGVVADVGARGDEDRVIVGENEFLRLVCCSEGGECVVWDKTRERRAATIREELGPPFVPSELWFKAYELSLERTHGRVKAILRARSNNFSGLSFSKEITLSASPLMTLGYRLTNEGTQAHTVQLNPLIRLEGNQEAYFTLPRTERLVHERAALFAKVHGDVPTKPEQMAEQWLAWRVDDFNLGLIWDDEVQEHEWIWDTARLSRPAITLAPGATAETPPLYLYAGPGDWADVRRVWSRLVSSHSGEPPGEPSQNRPRLGRKFEFGFDPPPILSLNDRVETTLRADSVRELPVEGHIVVEPPAGWRAEPAEFALKEIKHKQPLIARVQFHANADSDHQVAGAFTGRLYLESTRFDASEPFTLIRLGDETTPVLVKEINEDDQPLLVIDNGHSRWHIAPAYHAGVVGWYTSTGDVNHLYSAFPQQDGAAMGWLKPWFGGVQPILPLPHKVEDGWPGKLHQEQFHAQRCERSDERGFLWRGVRLSAHLEREEFRGMRAEIEYLTVGRGNLLKMIYRLVNETGVYRNPADHARPGVFAFCQVDGRHDNGTLYGDGVQCKRTPAEDWVKVNRWGAVTNPESGRTLLMVGGSARASLELSDWGQDGGHLLAYQTFVLPPHSQDEMVVYLILTDSLAEAQRYTALAAQ